MPDLSDHDRTRIGQAVHAMTHAKEDLLDVEWKRPFTHPLVFDAIQDAITSLEFHITELNRILDATDTGVRE
jgi:hypothetical protein